MIFDNNEKFAIAVFTSEKREVGNRILELLCLYIYLT